MDDFYHNLPLLETDRLILRKAESSDAPDVYAYASDADVTRFLRWGPHRSLAETETYLREMLSDYAQGRDGSWMIALKSSQTVVGSIHLFEIDPQERKAQVGFALAKAYWSQGYATEALIQVLQFAFTQLGLDRVEAWPIRDNLAAAARVLEKAGMHPEGEPTGRIPERCLLGFLPVW